MNKLASFAVLIGALMFLLLQAGGCKREPDASAAGSGKHESGSSASGSSTGGATATGSGSVVANDKEIIYQNLHIKLPWTNDAVSLIKISQEAAMGNGLSLTHDKTTLKVSSDGLTIWLDGKSYGVVKPNDRIELTADGKLLVNNTERSPLPAATAPAPK